MQEIIVENKMHCAIFTYYMKDHSDTDAEIGPNSSENQDNKKVLPRDRKRRTSRGIACQVQGRGLTDTYENITFPWY